jgi:D-3-phosphoglycerate dehydrogenase
VNAPQIAVERGIEVRPTASTTSRDYVNLITLRGGGHSLSGTLAGLSAAPKLVMVDEHSVEITPSADMLVVRNDDRPGIIGRVGTVLGDAGVNIADMVVGRDADGASALMVLSVDGAVASVLADLSAISGVHSVIRIVS